MGKLHRLETLYLLQRQTQALALFNQAKMRLGLGADKAQGHARFARAPGASNAMRVVHRRARQVKVHHHRQLRNVQTARRHIGGNHHAQTRSLEIRQYLRALALAQITVKRLRMNARLAQFFGHHLGGVLAGDKHQYTAPMVLLNQVAQQLRALPAINRNGALLNVRRAFWLGLHRHPQRVVQQRVRQCLHRRRKGRREKQVLPLLRQQLQNALQLVGKTQIKQTVGLIQHQRFDLANAQSIVIEQIKQAPRRGHHNVRAAAQAQHLRINRHPAKHDGNLHRPRQVRGQSQNLLANLGTQLARGH